MVRNGASPISSRWPGPLPIVRIGFPTVDKNETDGGALTGRFPACLGNEPDKAPLSATYTVSHSTGVSETTLHCAVVRSCHSRPAPFRSRFQNTRSVHRHSHISGAVLDVQLNEISGGFLEWESRSFWL